MRVAPLAFVLDPFDEKARVRIRDVVRITHNNDEAYGAAFAVVVAVRLALDGQRGHAGLSRIAQVMPDSRSRDALLDISAHGLMADDVAKKFGTSGFAAEVVPLALCAAFTGDDVLETLTTVVRFGGDADTIASIAGQVLGARLQRNPVAVIAAL
jgi:ADP-ribosylglycohydrolase